VRQVLTQALQQPDVIDGVIQGNGVRIVTKDKAAHPVHLKALEGGTHLTIEPIAPRFEDAFIDILGGGPGGLSRLAQETPLIKPKQELVIEAKGLVKRFGAFTAADHITFNVKAGEIFGLLGPNGAGKSTTFKMMCGLLKPTAGEAFVNGYDLQQAPAQARAHIGYMAQKFSLYGNLSVQQNLDFFSGIYNLTGRMRQKMIQEMVEIFNLSPYLNESAENLPLGFKQRLALSCSLMHRPEVLFLDEPTSGVDPITRREFWLHINGLVERGVTVMVTTHFMDEAEYCDRIGLVYRSQLITIGTPQELKLKVATKENPDPTLEDAFIAIVQNYDDKT
jgi:ABC-2 type transport system ATP-binding protein